MGADRPGRAGADRAVVGSHAERSKAGEVDRHAPWQWWARSHWAVRLVVLAMIWGCSFLFIKVGDEELAPLQVAFGRVLLGAAVLAVPVVAGRVRLPSGARTWSHLAVVALFFNTIPFTLFAYGEQRITSVAAGIWNALTPLATFPLAVAFLADTTVTRARFVGLMVGFAGVLVVLGFWSGFGSGQVVGDLECIAAAVCYGIGFVYTRRHLTGRGDGPLSLAAGQLFAATVELGALTVALTAAPHALPWRVVGSIAALGALGTGIAYVINYGLIAEVGPAVTSTVTYLVPAFSTVVGVALAGESLRWNQPVGALLIVGGAVLVGGRPRSAAAPPDPPARPVPEGPTRRGRRADPIVPRPTPPGGAG